MLEFALNCVFQLEFHIPRIVSTRNYLKLPVRKPTLYELVRASNLSDLEKLINTSSKEEVQPAVYEAMFQHNTTGLRHLADLLNNSMTDEHSQLLETLKRFNDSSI